MIKRLIAVAMTLLILAGLFGCGQKGTETDSESETVTDAPKTELLAEELASYKVIYVDGLSLNCLKRVRALQSMLEDKYGVEIASSSDNAEVGEYEILIGRTNRKESDEGAKRSPKVDDYSIVAIGKKIVVTAYTESKLIEAINDLIAHIEGLDEEGRFYGTGYEKLSLGEYDNEDMLIDGVSVSEYTIVYKEGNEGLALAQMVADAICEKSGYVLRMSTSPVDGRMILVGDTDKGAPSEMTGSQTKTRYYVGVCDGDLYLYGKELTGAYRAVEELIKEITAADGKLIELTPDSGEVTFEDASITSMTFNVYYDTSDSQRMNNVIMTIRKYSPDTFGVQEATGTWMSKLSSAFGSEYAYVGKGRLNNGSSGDEYSAIFYKKSRFELLESGTKWLSDTPDTVGSKMSGAHYPRVFTYALLKDKLTGENFLCVNTHTDHVDDGGAVRLKQVKVITDFIKANYPDTPLILTGDLNDIETASSIRHLLNSGLDDSADLALLSDKVPTFKQKTIDYLLLSKDDFTVYSYTVDTSTYSGEYPSDHRAVLIKYELKK